MTLTASCVLYNMSNATVSWAVLNFLCTETPTAVKLTQQDQPYHECNASQIHLERALLPGV